MEWPESFRDRYRPASSREVRSWSFGAVSRPRDPEARGWRKVRGSLDDQRVFGTKRDFECVCGKYQGVQHRNMVCDICGVKVAEHDVRRRRFGHIELGNEVPHPFGKDGETINAIPVLPAGYWESPGGSGLTERYEQVLGAVALE